MLRCVSHIWTTRWRMFTHFAHNKTFTSKRTFWLALDLLFLPYTILIRYSWFCRSSNFMHKWILICFTSTHSLGLLYAVWPDHRPLSVWMHVSFLLKQLEWSWIIWNYFMSGCMMMWIDLKSRVPLFSMIDVIFASLRPFFCGRRLITFAQPSIRLSCSQLWTWIISHLELTFHHSFACSFCDLIGRNRLSNAMIFKSINQFERLRRWRVKI